MKRLRAWRDGVLAYRTGENFGTNPYVPHPNASQRSKWTIYPLAAEWSRGYWMAQRASLRASLQEGESL